MLSHVAAQDYGLFLNPSVQESPLPRSAPALGAEICAGKYFLVWEGCLYCQNSPWGLVRIDAIGSAKCNCKENRLRKIAWTGRQKRPNSGCCWALLTTCAVSGGICAPSLQEPKGPSAVPPAVPERGGASAGDPPVCQGVAIHAHRISAESRSRYFQ